MTNNLPETISFPPILSIKGSAKLLDCSDKFIFDLIKAGALKPYYFGDRVYIFTDQLLESLKTHDSKWLLKKEPGVHPAKDSYLKI